MSNYFQTETSSNEPHQLVIDEHGKAFMLEAARWTKFLGITYAIVIGLMCLTLPLAVQMASVYQTMPYSVAGALIIVILIVGINIYPLYTMLSAATLVKKAIHENDQIKFNAGLKQAKNHMKFAGILTIILICFYGIIILLNLVIAFTATSVG